MKTFWSLLNVMLPYAKSLNISVMFLFFFAMRLILLALGRELLLN
jgi:hypothetical protein